jgi:hypothetical protein
MQTELNQYQDGAGRTAVYPGGRTIDGLLYVTTGLNGEAGEIAEHAKKALRDDGGELTDERKAALLAELGDVCWYCARTAREAAFKLGACGLSPEDYPDQPGLYPGAGTHRGFLYLANRLNTEAAKVAELAITTLPYDVPQGTHWLDVGQGRVVQGRLRTGVARVLWYVNEISSLCGSTLSDVLTANLAKLASRKRRGTLHGKGSER